ncbi:DNA polymerase II small subunit, partial [Halolamina litorea]
MPQESHRRLVEELTSRGYNAQREAVTILANAGEPELAAEAAADAAGDAFVVTVEHAREAVDGGLLDRAPDSERTPDRETLPPETDGAADLAEQAPTDMTGDATPETDLLTGDDGSGHPDVSTGTENLDNRQQGGSDGVEAKGSGGDANAAGGAAATTIGSRSPPAPEIRNDVT